MKTSCLIPCYNLEKYIVQCVESCSEFDQVVIGFDGCTDGSRELVEDWLQTQDPSVRGRYELLAWDVNQGAQITRNRLYESVSGDLICWFDGDDFRHPGLQEIVQALISLTPSNPEGDTLFAIAGVITPYKFWIKDALYKGETYQESIPAWMNPQAKEYGLVPDVWELLAVGDIQSGGILWKKDCIEEIKTRYSRIWDTQQEVLQEKSLILDALELGYSFIVHPFLSHTYRWGWSDKQITQARRDLYPARLEKYYNKLLSMASEKHFSLIQKERDRSIQIELKLAEDYKKYGINRIEPEFD